MEEPQIVYPEPTEQGRKRFPILYTIAFLCAAGTIGIGTYSLYSFMHEIENIKIQLAVVAILLFIACLYFTGFSIKAKTGASWRVISFTAVTMPFMGMFLYAGLIICPLFAYRLFRKRTRQIRLGRRGNATTFGAFELHRSGYPTAIVLSWLFVIHIIIMTYYGVGR